MNAKTEIQQYEDRPVTIVEKKYLVGVFNGNDLQINRVRAQFSLILEINGICPLFFKKKH